MDNYLVVLLKRLNEWYIKSKEIIFDDGDFVISIGIWDKTSLCLAMRYKGNGGGNSFPTSFGKPTWFVVPKMFARVIVESIEEHKKKEILKFLNIE